MLERILFILAGLFSGLLLAQSPYFGAPTPTQNPNKTPGMLEVRPPTPTEMPEKTVPAPIPPKESTPVSYVVQNVHDGDTITILKDGAQVKVRLIGMNAPEIYNYQKTPQCFGAEATARARELLEGKSVRIETDSSQDTYDKYGRLLAYAFLADGTNFAEQMIHDGYAHEYTYHVPYHYQKAFKAAQVQAQTSQLGLWKSGVCTSN